MEDFKKFSIHRDHVVQINLEQFNHLQNGSVVLVRSQSVKELGDHYVVIIGPPVLKTHGIRPETLTLTNAGGSDLLDQYDPIDGVTALLLTHRVGEIFRYSYGIGLVHGEVIYPKSLVVEEILRIFEGFRLPPTVIDQYAETGRGKLFERLLYFVRANFPIKFSMLGYPFKSKNTRDKVLGELADLGEEKSLDNFGYLAECIKQVYLPGVEFSIISDGYIFSDVWGIADNHVLTYNDQVRELARRYPVTLLDARDFYKKDQDLNVIREKIVTDFGITAEVLEKRILTDMNVNTIYRGMIIFMEEENAMMDFPSRTQREKFAKQLARKAMFRNEAYSALVQHEFADHIRLSMHASTNDGTKYSIRLIKDGIYKYSPWHSCLAIKADGTIETIHRKDGIDRGYELVNQNGRPYYFQEV